MARKADTLEIDLGAKSTRLALVDGNGSIAETEIDLGFDHLSYDVAGRVMDVAAAPGAMIADLGLAITQGTIPDQGVRLRAAGALAREALRCAAVIDEPMRRPEHLGATPFASGMGAGVKAVVIRGEGRKFFDRDDSAKSQFGIDLAEAFETEFTNLGIEFR
ncbi:hypothetical protein [Parasphingopyxis marina]|uniref:Uncharacterized protein n=1 Tax=Parasphingopyxis marina TaxID=2761622 RepID=A0A842HXN3_9SPHN|nr:hypothetical protein [Parasphingopyxis marina]MBC2778918.1 hypothetical protein [Parasphingopyxis marina]